MKGIHPTEIARLIHRTKASVDMLLSKQKREHDLVYPKGPSPRRKYNRRVIQAWRERLAPGWGSQRNLAKELGVTPAVISRELAKDLHGELP